MGHLLEEMCSLHIDSHGCKHNGELLLIPGFLPAHNMTTL